MNPFIKIELKPEGPHVETNVPMDVMNCLMLKGLLADVANHLTPKKADSPGILLARGAIPPVNGRAN